MVQNYGFLFLFIAFFFWLSKHFCFAADSWSDWEVCNSGFFYNFAHLIRMTKASNNERVLNIKNQTEAQGAAFFFKQWGTWGADGIKRNKHKNGKLIEGKALQAMPVV